MNILAIDPGLANLGWANRVDGKLNYGTITTPPHNQLHSRLQRLVIGIPFRHYDRLIIENCFGPAKTKLDYVIGSLITAINHGAYILVSPARWKRALCPKGRRETYGKKIEKIVRKAFFNTNPLTQHETDALGLLYWFELYGRKDLERNG